MNKKEISYNGAKITVGTRQAPNGKWQALVSCQIHTSSGVTSSSAISGTGSLEQEAFDDGLKKGKLWVDQNK